MNVYCFVSNRNNESICLKLQLIYRQYLKVIESLMVNHSEIMDNSWFVHFVVVFLPLKNKWDFRVDKRGTKKLGIEELKLRLKLHHL